MRTHFEATGPDVPLIVFVDEQLLQSARVLWPVLDERGLIGLVTLEEVRIVPPSERSRARVGEVMRVDLDSLTISPDVPAVKAIQALGVRQTPMVVVENGKVVGLLAQNDALKWLALHQTEP